MRLKGLNSLATADNYRKEIVAGNLLERLKSGSLCPKQC